MVLSLLPKTVFVNQSEIDNLARSLSSPVGKDLAVRAGRVKDRMKSNASGRPGPNIRSQNLYDHIAVFRSATDSQGIHFDIGPIPGSTVRRGYDYALVLEGIIPRGGAPPDGDYPFMEDALKAAR